MELDMRKMHILAAIIDDYILTAAPVGSRSISRHADIGLSSATIRNEMSDLEELGFLEQPHTSAGRVPSDKAYRLYVNGMMHRSMLNQDEMRYIKQHFSDTIDNVEEVVKQTAWVLSSVTRYTAMVLPPQIHGIKLKHIQLVPVSESKALAVIVTDAGITRDSIIRIPRGMDVEQLESVSRILTGKLANKRIDEITSEAIPELAAELGESKAFLESVLNSINTSLGTASGKVELSGTKNILEYPEYNDMEKARNFLTALETKDRLYKMLKDASRLEFTVTIGQENNTPDMQDCSIVTATYRVSDTPMGSLGIIGPTRMNYSKVLAILRYIGDSMSEVLTNMFEEERN